MATCICYEVKTTSNLWQTDSSQRLTRLISMPTASNGARKLVRLWKAFHLFILNVQGSVLSLLGTNATVPLCACHYCCGSDAMPELCMAVVAFRRTVRQMHVISGLHCTTCVVTSWPVMSFNFWVCSQSTPSEWRKTTSMLQLLKKKNFGCVFFLWNNAQTTY